MTSDLASQVRDVLTVDREEFQSHVEEDAEVIKRELADGTFDNPQSIVGFEYEFYAVDAETKALSRVPRRLLSLIGFEKELGLHNAEMSTSPQPLNEHGLAAQEAEVKARLSAAEERTGAEGMRLVSDGLWTIPPTGETATRYLTDGVDDDGIQIASNMSNSVRYHAMANTGEAVGMELDAPNVSLSAKTVMPESLITSIQPHYQVPHARDLPSYFQYAVRIAGPAVGARRQLAVLPAGPVRRRPGGGNRGRGVDGKPNPRLRVGVERRRPAERCGSRRTSNPRKRPSTTSWRTEPSSRCPSRGRTASTTSSPTSG